MIKGDEIIITNDDISYWLRDIERCFGVKLTRNYFEKVVHNNMWMVGLMADAGFDEDTGATFINVLSEDLVGMSWPFKQQKSIAQQKKFLIKFKEVVKKTRGIEIDVKKLNFT